MPEPSEFTPTDHFIHRMKQRQINSNNVEETIRTGETSLDEDGNIEVVKEVCGITYKVILDPSDMVAVTVVRPSLQHSDSPNQRDWAEA